MSFESTPQSNNTASTIAMVATDAAVHARAVPVSASYFSRQPHFNDSYLLLAKLVERYRKLPILPAEQVERVAWKTLEDFRQAVGEQVKATDFGEAMQLVKRLNQIHPKLKPKEVEDALVIFKRTIQPYANKAKPIPIDKFGRALGVGKRKTSVARAWVVEGTGEMLVNGKTLADAFGRVHDRESATWALRATDRVDKYNVWALVEGGGTTGQAEALTLAVAKALMAHEPALKPALRRGTIYAVLTWFRDVSGTVSLTALFIAGCVTRDPRKVERKKHGHVKARKSPTWVKR
jgi:small subunit ribosomal protein S9